MALDHWVCAGLLAAAFGLTGAEYFVDVRGSDRNPGTASSPFRTAKRAAQAVRPGDVVTLNPGIHAGDVKIVTSGTKEKPIVFRGVRGKKGEYLSVIDPGKPVTGWVPAPEIAEKVWKAPMKDRPASVLLDGRQVTYIARLRMKLPRRKELPKELTDPDFAFKNTPPPYDRSKLLPGFDLLALPADILVFHKQVDWRLKKKQAFWPAIGGVLCGWRDGFLYFRFADGSSPEGRNITAGTGNGFWIRDKGHVVIEDLEIRGVGMAVFLTGREAAGNVIRRNRLMHGTARISVEQGSTDNLIEDNFLTLGFIGARNHGSGFWKENRVIYLTFKYIAGDRQTSNDAGIQFRNPGTGNVVRRNLICQGLIGIQGREGGMVKIYDNFVREMSSVGIVPGYASSMEIHDNFIMDCAINLRLHSVCYFSKPRLVYIYRNVLYQSPDFGMQIFFSTSSNHIDLPEEIWICSNTVYKSSSFGNVQAFYRTLGERRKHPVRMLNNLIYLDAGPVRQNFEIFSGNVFAGKNLEKNAQKELLEGGFGRNTVIEVNDRTFSSVMEGGFAALVPAADSPLCRVGVDVGNPFTVGGKTYPALPGMKPGEHVVGARRPGEDLSFQKKMFRLSEELRAK